MNIRLTATEMGNLWSTYIKDSMAKCILGYFLAKVEDKQIQPVVEFALENTEQQLTALKLIFTAEKFPLPVGFTDEDVNLQAQRLFSDTFFLDYIKNMCKVGLGIYGLAYTLASRADVRTFFENCLDQTRQLDQKATEVQLSKGVYIRPPYIPVPDHTEFTKSLDFLSGGFFGFGDKRSLIAMEISHLAINIQTNALGKALMIGFSQVARSPKIRDYLVRGKEISSKHIQVFSQVLIDEDLPAPSTWDHDVLEANEPPFSDKLMLFNVSLLTTAGFGNYALAAAASLRSDIETIYITLSAETARFSKDGAKIMIEHGWLEEPPQSPDRKKLAGVQA